MKTSQKKPVRSVRPRLVSLKAGVDLEQFGGQRRVIVKALKRLSATKKPVQITTVISAVRPGYPARVPVEASVIYHIRGLQKDKVVSIKKAA